MAKKAGVSVSTVSHVVNGTRFVSEDLRSKVNAAMSTMDYQPNHLARSLRRKSSGAIGLILADITNPFFSEIAWRIENLSFNQDYSVMLCNTNGDHVKENYYLNRLSEWKVEGIIVVTAASAPAHLQSFNRPEMPIILVDYESAGYAMDSISVDNFSGGKMAAEHLISLGHKRIACIGGSVETRYNQGRLNGFRDAMQDAGLELDEALVAKADFTTISGYNVGNQLLELQNPPTAIFACSDLMAYGVMKAAYEKGINIPNDLSLVGFDDIYMSRCTVPPLTTVRQPMTELAEEALNCLLTRKDDPGKTTRDVKLKLHLEVRGTTAPLNLEKIKK